MKHPLLLMLAVIFCAVAARCQVVNVGFPSSHIVGDCAGSDVQPITIFNTLTDEFLCAPIPGPVYMSGGVLSSIEADIRSPQAGLLAVGAKFDLITESANSQNETAIGSINFGDGLILTPPPGSVFVTLTYELYGRGGVELDAGGSETAGFLAQLSVDFTTLQPLTNTCSVVQATIIPVPPDLQLCRATFLVGNSPVTTIGFHMLLFVVLQDFMGGEGLSIGHAEANYKAALVRIDFSDVNGNLLYVDPPLGNIFNGPPPPPPVPAGTISSGSGINYPVQSGIPTTPPPDIRALAARGRYTFDFGAFSLKINYTPPATADPALIVTATPVLLSPEQFALEQAQTSFPGARCIPLDAPSGGCLALQIRCSTVQGGLPCDQINLPGASFDVAIAFDSLSPVVNPALLNQTVVTSPQIGLSQTNALGDYFLQKLDPTAKGVFTALGGRYAVASLGVSPTTEAGLFGGFQSPLSPPDTRKFVAGANIPVRFGLTSVATQLAVTTAKAQASLARTAQPDGTAVFEPLVLGSNTFVVDPDSGSYQLQINTTGFPEGSYTLTVYSDSFPSQAVDFTIASTADTTPPSISCGLPDGVWHATDVGIACTATDTGSGLANPADASFTLTTSVPAGTETTNALTNSRTVCDNAGNCATAGPIGGNKVDKKPPSIVITSPTVTTYTIDASVLTGYGCTDGGSGVAVCNGPVASGAALNTAQAGSFNFTVNAADAVGNASSQSVAYNVTYGVCLLYDPTKAKKVGSTVPLKLFLCDAAGRNVSSPAVAVTAVSLTTILTSTLLPIDGSGSANANDLNFRFSADLTTGGGYIFNLGTTGLPAATFKLTFQAGTDPLTHDLFFQLQ